MKINLSKIKLFTGGVFLSAFLWTIAFPPFSVSIMIFIALVPLLTLIRLVKFKRVILWVSLCGVITATTLFYWIAIFAWATLPLGVFWIACCYSVPLILGEFL
ncbi:MAG: hypothetical protein KAS39_07800, partial [Actinomycetia bacterium]|nr:hypothetical protein [Actinomycetes bacterium]